jgi:hypothetical protein
MLRHARGFKLAKAGVDTGRYRPTSGTATSSTPCAILNWHLVGSKDFWRD